jgi:hypothetical protein
MIGKFAAAFNLSTAETLDKLEALIKERCESEKVQSAVSGKRGSTKSRQAN